MTSLESYLTQVRERAEVWRTVADWDLYSVSNLGRVKGHKGKILKPGLTEKGYVRISLRQSGRVKYICVHTLVLEAFVGKKPEGNHGSHLNNIRSDNRLVNLKWMTPKENEHMKRIHGTVQKGSRHWCAKVTAKDVAYIRKNIRKTSYRESNAQMLADKFGITRPNVWAIVRGVTWADELVGGRE